MRPITLAFALASMLISIVTLWVVATHTTKQTELLIYLEKRLTLTELTLARTQKALADSEARTMGHVRWFVARRSGWEEVERMEEQ